VLAVVGALAVTLVPSGTTAGAAGSDAGATDPRSGEPGSGLPPLPVEPPPARSIRAAGFAWSDVDGSDAWARKAIDYVGKARRWMRDFAPKPDGTVPFKPDMVQTRKYLARALVKAFAPGAVPDPSVTFTDLDATDTFTSWATIAVQRGWMTRTADGRFRPDKAVSTKTLHAALVDVLGLAPTARRLDRLATAGGARIPTPKGFGSLMLGLRLGLRHNNTNEAMDVGPRSKLSRAQVAYSLYKASTLPTWVVPWLRDQYDRVVLPTMGARRLQIVRWGVQYVGYPYVWGGEWGLGDAPSALGGQPVPGFDCSGITWWAMRANDGAWHVHPPRPYAGWTLPQRTSADMARFGNLKYGRLLPGDLMFYDGNGDGRVDHVNVYVGNGFALDSSSSTAGVTIMPVGEGWYRDHFVHGRRIIPTK
jgi:cell wall-associated NlpC family hydrolase